MSHGDAIDDADVRIRCDLGLRPRPPGRPLRHARVVWQLEDGQCVTIDRPDIQIGGFLHCERHRDLIGAFVARCSDVTSHPLPSHVTRRACSNEARQLFPELTVQHIAALSRFPSALPPAPHPLRDALDQIRGVCIDRDRPRLIRDVLQRCDRAAQLHPVVRGVRRSAAEFGDAPIRCDDDRAPATRAWIAFRGAVGEDDDL